MQCGDNRSANVNGSRLVASGWWLVVGGWWLVVSG